MCPKDPDNIWNLEQQRWINYRSKETGACDLGTSHYDRQGLVKFQNEVNGLQRNLEHWRKKAEISYLKTRSL